MKRYIPMLLLLCICSTGAALGQLTKDSLPVIKLSELTVNSTLKNMQGRVQEFVMANKNASTEEILARLPEINMIRRGSYGMEPQIRSYHSGQTNLLIDGMRVHGACTDKMDPASIYIEPQNLQGIHVNSNTGSHVGSSIGGTINLSLASAMPSCEPYFRGEVSSGYQSASNAFYESAVLQYARHGWAIRANATYRKAGDYRSGGGRVIPYSSNEKLNYGLSATHGLRHSGFIKLDVLMDDAWYIGYPALPMDVGRAKARILALSLFDLDIHPKWKQTELKIYANRVSHAMDDTRRVNVPMHMDMPGLSETIGAYASATQVLNKKSEIRWRLDAASTYLKASMTMYPQTGAPMYMLTWPENRMIQAGFGGMFIRRLDSTSSMTVSTRFDQYRYSLESAVAKDQLSVLNMSTSDIHALLKNVQVEYTKKMKRHYRITVSLGYAERIPTASEFYGFYLFNAFDNFDYLGNTSLKREQALKADLQFAYNRKKLHFTWNLYISRIRHLIAGTVLDNFSVMTPGATGVKQYRNLPHATLAGTEAAMMWKPAKGWQWLSTLKYHYGTDQDGNPLPLIAPLRLVSSLRKEITRLSLQAECETASRQERVSKMAGERVTPAFWLIHARASYTFKLKYIEQLRVDLGVENILDRSYYEHLDWNRVPRAGRNFYVMLTCGF